MHRGLNLTRIAFYKVGALGIAKDLTVSVDKPCLALVRQADGKKLMVSVSNPENKELTVTVKASRRLKGENVKIIDDGNASEATFHLSGGELAGRSVTAELTAVKD